MPRSIVPQIENNFTRGLITEATALNFPENACTDTDNCVFHPKGDVYRRLGLDFEEGYHTKTTSRTGSAMATYAWYNPAGQEKTFLVIQVGRFLTFYNVADDAISAGAHSTTIDLDDFATDITALAQNECQFASGQGYLFVVHPFCDPFYIRYDPDTNTLIGAVIDVKVRDTDGIIDELGYAYDTRPTSLTNKHKYNLYNQGWAPTPTNYINSWRTDYLGTNYIPLPNPPYYLAVNYVISPANANYPSNSDVWWMCLGGDRIFYPGLANSNKRGNTPAPKGYYVMSAWDMDRSAASGISGIDSTTSGIHRPSAIAFHAGRVFYAGTNAEGYTNKIFFTQVIKSTEQFGRCHQLNDPTNENLFDLLATDGGTVTIPDMGRVIKMFSIQTSLIVFCTNGVWVVAGNQNIAFSAGDYSVRRVSSIPAIAAQSFVDVEGLPCWWNYDGVYMVTDLNNAGGVKIDSLTQSTIRTYFKEKIPVSSKLYATGSYNQLTKEIRWLWRSSDTVTSFEQNYEYDRALTFNMLTKGFYPWSFNTTTEKVVGLTSLKTRGTFHQETAPGTMTDVTSMQGSVTKYLVSNGSALTFAETKNASYTDFGDDYESFFTTGYTVQAGAGARRSQPNYVILYCRYQDNPEFYFRGVFDFANSENSMRWGSKQLIQFPEIGDYDYQVKKIKLRGTGRSIQFKVSSSSGKPFDIAGWSRWQTTNTSI